MPISNNQKQQLKLLGARVKAFRVAKKLTLMELSYSIGKDHQSIHRLESGNINPSYLYLKELCIGLEIDISELLRDLE